MKQPPLSGKSPLHFPRDFPRHHGWLCLLRRVPVGRLRIKAASCPWQAATAALLHQNPALFAGLHLSCPWALTLTLSWHCSTMKLLSGLLLCSLVLGVSSQRWFSFIGEATQGAWDMWRAYSDMREANYINADKYFHARGNYDAAQRGPGGVWAAKVIR
nr:serum amyloid A-1 protein isoform X2 [Oryctolagus cuniculus]